MFGFQKRRTTEALCAAIQASDLSALRPLLRKGADANSTDENGWPCLVNAASRGNVEVVKALIEAGARINQKCPAKLDERQRRVYRELRRRGLQAGIPQDNWSAMLEAVSQGKLSVVALLLEHGADVNMKYPAQLEPDDYVWDSVTRSMGSQAGVDPHSKDGWTALMEAAKRGHSGIVEVLLARRADFDGTTRDGTTSLMRAAMEGHASCVRALLAKGAPVEATNRDGWTALFYASARGHVGAMKLLLENNADVNKKNHGNATPLMWAVQANTEAVKILLNAGALVNEVSNKGGGRL